MRVIKYTHYKHIKICAVLVTTLLLSIAVLVGCAAEKPSMYFQYVEVAFPDVTYLAIQDCQGTEEHVVIPAENDGLEVRYIYTEAFSHVSNMRSLDLGNVRQIYDKAFSSCQNLEKVDLGIVERIGQVAFNRCHTLSSITIPETVQIIEDGAFSQCENLNKVYFKGNPESLGDGIFDEGVIIYGIPGGTVEEYARQEGHTFMELESNP